MLLGKSPNPDIPCLKMLIGGLGKLPEGTRKCNEHVWFCCSFWIGQVRLLPHMGSPAVLLVMDSLNSHATLQEERNWYL